MISKNKWNAEEDGVLTESAVRRRYRPPERFRVAVYSYPAGTRFRATGRSGTCYVITGCCRFDFEDRLVLCEGEYAVLPSGEHDFEVIGKESAEMVFVWELPGKVWPKRDDDG